LTFCELAFEQAGLAYPLDGSLESFLLSDSCSELLLHIIAQMAFKFVQDLGRLDTSGVHLPPPVRDCFVEIEHVGERHLAWWSKAGATTMAVMNIMKIERRTKRFTRKTRKPSVARR